MCIILDVNMVGVFLQEDNPDMKPLRNCVLKTKKAKLAYSPTDQFEREWEKAPGTKFFGELKKNGMLEEYDKAKVIRKQTLLKEKYKLVSNDLHILALATVSGSKLLVSNDQDLHQDFKKIINKGRVYQYSKDKKLLEKAKCPPPISALP